MAQGSGVQGQPKPYNTLTHNEMGWVGGVASTKLTRKENVILIALVTMVTVSLEWFQVATAKNSYENSSSQ